MDLSALGKESIRPDQPSGSDVRYDPLFDELQAEVDRTSLPSMAGAVDWDKVVTLSADILSRKSKDLLVTGYLAVGLIHTRGLDGLAIALKVYRDLLEQHGRRLFPGRQRGRLRSVEWWLEKCEAALKPLEGCFIHPEQLVLMEENLEKLGQLLSELLPEAPSLQMLHGFLQRAAQSRTDDDIDSTSASGSAQAPQPVRQEAIPVVAERTAAPPWDSRATVEQGLHQLRETAALLRNHDLAHPLAYRFSRHAAWAAVADLPPAEAGRTLLSPPPSQLRNQLEELRRGGDSTSLLKVIEGQLGQFIFWLDLNRLAAEALADLDAAQAAVAAVGQETAFLLQRLPGLDELVFADGTPFADAETRVWLKKLLPGGKRRPVAPPPEKAGPEPEGYGLISGEMDASRALIGEGKLIEAVERFQERLENASSGRERLQWRLALSRVLMDAEQTLFALPHLEQVVRDIGSYRLEQYDPAMALEGLKLAWHGFESRPEPRFKEKANEALHRIARLDAAEMVRLIQNGE